ncbi:MAG: hypothetical protein GAK39_03131 [Variovorax sp.]|nr:MAG: hypothetical protein GAK39_03131 [Variovorax sp.]
MLNRLLKYFTQASPLGGSGALSLQTHETLCDARR